MFEQSEKNGDANVRAASPKPSQLASHVSPVLDRRPEAQKITQLQAAANQRGDRPVQRHATTEHVAQLALKDDLQHGTINAVMAGEIHEEIPPQQEISEWNKVGVSVYHESDVIRHKISNDHPMPARMNTTPDPAMLRLGFLWTTARPGLNEFWKSYLDHGDLSEAELTFDNVNELYRRAGDEIEALKLADPIIDEIEGALSEVRQFMPPSSENLLAKTAQMKKIIALSQLNALAVLDSNMKELHRSSSFKDTLYTKDTLMIERSRQMLLRMNKIARGIKKAVYKVGEEHITDMSLLGIAPASSLRVLGRDEYKTQYDNLRNFNATQSLAGNANVFNAISNDNL